VDQAADRVTVAPGEIAFSALGDTVRVEAVAFDRNGHEIVDESFEWTTSDAGVAVVSGAGAVTGSGGGEATITATSGSASAPVTVSVDQVAEQVRISPANVVFAAVGQTGRLYAYADDANGYVIEGASFSWISEDPGVAEVDQEGVVTTRAKGETGVTATLGALTARATVKVAPEIAKVWIAPVADTLREVGDTLRMQAYAFDANDNHIAGVTFDWRSLEPSVVTVDQTGLVTARGGRGIISIEVKANGKTDRETVTRIPWGRLVLTFDDVFEDHYTRVRPILDDLGIRANLAVPTGWVDEPGRLTTEQVRALYQAGWGIISHSVTHSDLRYLNDADLEWELTESQRWVRDEIGPGGEDVFVVPFHRWASGEENQIRKYYKATRGYGTDHSSHGGMVDWPPVDPHALTSIPADGMLTSAGIDAMEAMWIEAIHQGKFVGTYFHSISAGNEAMFREAMQRLAKYGAHLYTYPELF